jgi:hypothetical protein
VGFAGAGEVVATMGSGALRNREKKPVVPSLMPPHVSETLPPMPLQSRSDHSSDTHAGQGCFGRCGMFTRRSRHEM